MKSKIALALLFLGLSFSFAQQDEECVNKLSIFHEHVKAFNFDAAYEPWMAVMSKCPKLSLAIYVDGEKILEDKISKSDGAEKVGYINALIKLWQSREEHFWDKTPKGKYDALACQLLYDNKEIMQKNTQELYDCFDAAYKLDKETFTDPKSLYTYFSLMLDLYDAQSKSAAELFNKYDEIADKIEGEVKRVSASLNQLIEKQETGVVLTSKEEKHKTFYEQTLAAYDQISSGIDQKLGQRANCENLVPLYAKDFETFKADALWLKHAVGRMYNKECTDNLLYEKLVKAYDDAEPSADTKYFVGTILFKSGKEKEAISYFKESFDLETEAFKKAMLANRIGVILKKEGRFGEARAYFRDALKFNPSNLNPHLLIASMYADSANNCGNSEFNKRAVYWLAAQEARKAGSAGIKLAEGYVGRAPSKQDVFTEGNQGKVINIGCWIKASVVVPNI